jgi:hypothetical protein
MMNLNALMELVKSYNPLLKRSERKECSWELFIYVPGKMASEDLLERFLAPFLPPDFLILGWDEDVVEDACYECIIYF